MAYQEMGSGNPIVLLHGNPTSSFLWRNIVPELEGMGRIVAPDLIGHGDSDKLPLQDGANRYTFEVTFRYLDSFLKSINAQENVTLVVHDWGSGLGFHWANLNPNSIKGIAYMEAIVMPLTWNDWPESARGIFKGFRSPKGEDLVLDRNMFVEAVLPGSIIRAMTNDEMASYRAPFKTPEDRQPILNWPRQIPIDGTPAHMKNVVESYANFMSESPIPKLFINADPGSILVGKQREFCRSWPNQTEVTVRGKHFIQEDSPKEIGRAIRDWYVSL